MSMSFELLDDQLASVALQDALAFIDAYEHSASASAPALTLLPADPPSQNDGQVHIRTNNPSRGAHKSELHRLRHDVKLLESKLARLKSESEPRQSNDSPDFTSDSSNSENGESSRNDGALTSTWRTVALRQNQRRIQSEMTNRKLKQVLFKQLKVANALQAIFMRRTAQNDLELVYDSRASISHRCETTPLDRDDSISLLLLSQVHQVRLEIDIHMFNAGLIGSEGHMLRTISKPDVAWGTVLETTSSASIPLSLEAAGLTLWSGMTLHFKPKPGGPPKTVAVVEEGLDKGFVTTATSAQYSFNYATRNVTRRFVARGRIFYVWASIAAVPNKNVRFRGEGLIVLERSSASTQMKNWHRVHAERIDSQLLPSGSGNEIERLMVTGMKTISRTIEAYFSSLENVLLEAAADKSGFQLVPLCVTSAI